MSDHVIHWDDVEGYQRTAGDIDAHWYDLGSASGSDRIGLNRIRIEPGRRSTPAHIHGAEEEIFYVLDGWGLLWQDGDVCEVRAGDVIVHLAGAETHTLHAGLRHVASPEGVLTCVPHCHSAEEELFVVLEGRGVCRLGDESHDVRPGSVVARPAGTAIAHSFTAGEGGIALLAYGTRDPHDICFYPRSGKIAISGLGVVGRIEPVEYWEGEEL